MDAADTCDAECCCCSCDVDVEDCECDFECCDGACGDLSDACEPEDCLQSLCCGLAICFHSENEGDAKDEKQSGSAASKDVSQAPQVTPVKVELLGVSQPQLRQREPRKQLTSM